MQIAYRTTTVSVLGMERYLTFEIRNARNDPTKPIVATKMATASLRIPSPATTSPFKVSGGRNIKSMRQITRIPPPIRSENRKGVRTFTLTPT